MCLDVLWQIDVYGEMYLVALCHTQSGHNYEDIVSHFQINPKPNIHDAIGHIQSINHNMCITKSHSCIQRSL